jgi:anti-sigma factor RsiW
MRCREVVDALGAYLDGELPEARRAPIDEHLAGCAGCHAYLATYRRTVKLAGDAFRDPDAPGAPGVPESLVDAVLAARRKR